jgi:N utilization substance protein A
MVNFSTIGNTEILQIIEAVAREKGIQRDAVIEAMEQAVQVAGRRKYGHEHNIHAVIDRKTGEIKLSRQL